MGSVDRVCVCVCVFVCVCASVCVCVCVFAYKEETMKPNLTALIYFQWVSKLISKSIKWILYLPNRSYIRTCPIGHIFV